MLRETDTILILHVLDAVNQGKVVDIMTPDTDVFNLAASRCLYLGKDTQILTGTGVKWMKVCIQSISYYDVIG